jgi:hypothetical protein
MRGLLMLLTAWTCACGNAHAQAPVSIDGAIGQVRAHPSILAQGWVVPQPCIEPGIPTGCIDIPMPPVARAKGDMLDSRPSTEQSLQAKHDSLVRLVSLLERKAALLEASMAYPPRTLWEFQLLRQESAAQRNQILALEKQLAARGCEQGKEMDRAKSE